MAITNIFTKRLIPGFVSAVIAATTLGAHADSSAVLELYVDAKTQQIFAEPGPGRVKLGRFQLVDEGDATLEQRLITRQQAHETKVEQTLATVVAPAAASAVSISQKGLEVKSADGNFAIGLGGRIHADASTHLDDSGLVKRGTTTAVEATSGSEIRRSRIALRGTAYQDFNFLIEGDWAGNEVSMKDVLVTYVGYSPLEVTVGNQKHAVSMELEESSNDIMFNERSLLAALSTPHFDRALGVNLKTKGDNWSLQGGLYGDGISSSGEGSDEGSGWGARGTFAPINTSDQVVHLGASLGQRKANDRNTLSNSKSPRFRYETTNLSDFYLSDTGTVANFEDVTLAVLEGAVMTGPWSLQGEYGSASVGRASGSDTDFEAWYVQGAWTLTGESRSYKGSDGEFKRLKPANNFSPTEGGWGAWELALRYDQLDLTDSSILGGEQDRLTLNLNWYMNESLRMLLGYSRAFNIDGGPVTTDDGGDVGDFDLISLRTQWAF